MNLWIKYWPLNYTNITRINWIEQKNNNIKFFSQLLNIIWYAWNNLSIWLLSILTLYIFWVVSLKIGFMYMLLYVYLYIVFWMFYEIWYIYNDVYSVKKEKKGTNRIKDSCSNKFWIYQILLRIVIWWILLIPIYLFLNSVFICFVPMIFATLIIFLVHNIIRNYSINMYTLVLLRILKMSVFILVLINLPLLKWNIDDILLPILLFWMLDLFSEWIIAYNQRLWGMVVDNFYGYSYVLIFIFCVLFWVITKNEFFVIISFFQLFPRFILFLHRFPKSFSLKNNR